MTSKNITNFDPTIDFIKTHLKITDLYNFVKGQKNPRDKHKFVCPFCHSGERGDAAFHIYDDSNTYKCYACDEQGDIFTFYKKLKNLDFLTAKEELARMCNAPTDNFPSYSSTPPQAVKAPAQQGPVEAAVETAPPVEAEKPPADYTEYYKKCAACFSSPEGEAARNYFENRGLSIGSNPFWIGFDPVADPCYNPDNKDAKHHYCPRLIIPISKGFYLARRIDDKAEYAKVYPFGATAAIWNEKAIGKNDTSVIFVTEAIFDALSLIEAGHQAVATNSTSNVPRLIEKLKLNPPTDKIFVLSFDHDSAGYKAAEQLMKALIDLKLPYMLAEDSMYNGCKDLNEALQKDRDAFFAACDAAEEKATRKKEIDNALRNDPFNAYYRQDFMERLEAFRKSVVPTGIKSLDKALEGGVHRGIYLLAGIPACGKTALAVQITSNIAEIGRKVLFFELELNFDDLKCRLISHHNNQEHIKNSNDKAIRSAFWYQKHITVEQHDKFNEEHKDMLKNISFIDNSTFHEKNYQDIAQLSECVDNYIITHKNDKPPVVIIDYAQLCECSDSTARYNELRKIFNILKRLRDKYDLPIIVLSSMSRENYELPAFIAAAKESGDIEYACEAIFVLLLKVANEGELSRGDKKEQKAESRKLSKEETRKDPRIVQLACTKCRRNRPFFTVNMDYYAKADYFDDLGIDEDDNKNDATMSNQDDNDEMLSLFNKNEINQNASFSDIYSKKKPKKTKKLAEVNERMGEKIRNNGSATATERNIPNYNLPTRAEEEAAKEADLTDLPF